MRFGVLVLTFALSSAAYAQDPFAGKDCSQWSSQCGTDHIINWSPEKREREVTYELRAPSGYEFCEITVNEFNAAPKAVQFGGSTIYTIEKGPSCSVANATIKQTCNGGTPVADVIAALTSVDTKAGDTLSKLLKSHGRDCVGGAADSWLDTHFTGVIRKIGGQCPYNPGTHNFRGPQFVSHESTAKTIDATIPLLRGVVEILCFRSCAA